MANTDGYYFTVATKTTIDPITGIGTIDGKNAVLWYKTYKSGGKNDGETPDDIVTMNTIYPQGTAPPAQDPAILDDGFGNRSKYSPLIYESKHVIQ
jgi:hypothetical protein